MRIRVAMVVLSTLVAAGAASAGAPRVGDSTVPAGIWLVGDAAGVPDPEGSATYVIRRGNLPMMGSSVIVDFSGCPDVRLSNVTAPGFTVDCANRRISGFTDATGTVTFRVVGSSGPGARAAAACAQVFVDGVLFPPLAVGELDLDGRSGVDAVDLSAAYGDLVSGQYRARCDYDFDGDLDMIDLSLMARVFFKGGSTASGALCP